MLVGPLKGIIITLSTSLSNGFEGYYQKLLEVVATTKR